MMGGCAPPPITTRRVEDLPRSTHLAAANGEAQAFADLANTHYQNAIANSGAAIIELTRAAVYARLAAMQRGLREDWASFLFLLDQHALACQAGGFAAAADASWGEAIALAEFAADDGDEEMGTLAANAENVTPGALEVARNLRLQFATAMETAK